MTWYINSLELSPSEGIYLTKEPELKPSEKHVSNTTWMGLDVDISNVQPQQTKHSFSGWCTSLSNLRKIAIYSAGIYNWNDDPDSVYLIYELSRRWKIKSLVLSNIVFQKEDEFSFDLDITLGTPRSEGYPARTSSGTLSGGNTSINGLINSGDVNSYFELGITGTYTSGANLTNPILTHSLLGYDIEVATKIHDTATFTFYSEGNKAKYYYLDPLTSGTLFTRNKESSTGVTFDTNHLDFANSSNMVFKYELLHPLISDPVLCLSISALSGDPVLQVSNDNTNWWDIDKSLVAGTRVNYPLTRISGSSTFYWRIVCDSNDSLTITRIEFTSWHNYSDSSPIPYIIAGATDDMVSISYSAGGGTYSLSWRDKFSI